MKVTRFGSYRATILVIQIFLELIFPTGQFVSSVVLVSVSVLLLEEGDHRCPRRQVSHLSP